MPPYAKRGVLALFAATLLVSPLILWLAHKPPADDPISVLASYLKFLYARDLSQSYRHISMADQRIKKQADYVRERGAFSGFALEAARKLGEAIEIRPVSQRFDGRKIRLKVALRLPDANRLGSLLLDWDERKLNRLPTPEQKKILATIAALERKGALPMIEGEEEFTLVREDSRWKIFLNWAAGVKVAFATRVPAGGTIEAEPIAREIVVRRGDPFTIGFKVKNITANELRTRIEHRVEPKELTPYLDLVECALLLPVRLRPGEEQIYNSTYVLGGDLPENTNVFNVTYAFKIEP
ncbi:MAG TPA: cytochrome c oxidase assembly protein [Candidatus Binatia bacterium]|nr:cytochrome c oxidase assembly protein [Candidatus Binatia bacterium]